ncbi:MAG: hypothetical protein O2795_17315 [Acidobacteria bacterium]|nr:hypothetical protein [Acidobacteriota bacterium]
MMTRLIHLAIAVALIIPVSGLGQEAEPPIDLEPVRQRVKELLWSPLAKDQAWGAYLIGELSLDELAPELIEFVERGGKYGFDGEHEYALRAAVDSMIRLRVSPPPGLLERYNDQLPDEVIVLLSFEPELHAERLLDLMQQEQSAVRRDALFSLAAQSSAPGLPLWLLEGLRIEATVFIRDPRIRPGFERGGGVSSLPTCGRGISTPTGYPPIGVYQIVKFGQADSIVLSYWMQPRYYDRIVSRSYRRGHPCPHDGPLTDNERLDYLAELVHQPPSTLGLKAAYSSSVVVSAEGDLERAIQKLTATIEDHYGGLVDMLSGYERLTPDESKLLRAQISVKVIDKRAGQ